MSEDAPLPVSLRLGIGREAGYREPFHSNALEVSSAKGVRGPERLLLDCLEGISGRVLVVGTREGIVAQAIALLNPACEVHRASLDAYDHCRANAACHENGANAVRCLLGSDLPLDASYDWVILPVPHAAEAMLSHELIAEAWQALLPQGKLLAVVDSGRDHWVHGRILDTFGTATIHRREDRAMAYVARKRADRPPRPRNFRRVFRARVYGNEVEAETRPGVFSHGHLDSGTLALAECTTPLARSLVVEIGCGAGVLGVGAVLAAEGVRAVLVDAGVRAVQSARDCAVRNGVTDRTTVLLAHDLAALREGSVDLVLANPPYLGEFAVLEHFAREGWRVLRRGGRLALVTKSPREPTEFLHVLFSNCERQYRRGYTVLQAVRRS